MPNGFVGRVLEQTANGPGAMPRAQAVAMDHVAAIAQRHFKVPVAVVILVNRNGVDVVGARGLPLGFVHGDYQFARLASQSDGVMVIEDARSDARFRNNPLVVGKPYLRFVAGAPLMAGESEVVGTVCIADYEPRQLNVGQRIVLKHLARVAGMDLGDHRSDSEAAAASARNAVVFQNVNANGG